MSTDLPPVTLHDTMINKGFFLRMKYNKLLLKVKVSVNSSGVVHFAPEQPFGCQHNTYEITEYKRFAANIFKGARVKSDFQLGNYCEPSCPLESKHLRTEQCR